MGTENIVTEWRAYVFVTDLVVIIWQWGPKDGCVVEATFSLDFHPGHQRLPDGVKMAITAYGEHIFRHSVEEQKKETDSTPANGSTTVYSRFGKSPRRS